MLGECQLLLLINDNLNNNQSQAGNKGVSKRDKKRKRHGRHYPRRFNGTGRRQNIVSLGYII